MINGRSITIAPPCLPGEVPCNGDDSDSSSIRPIPFINEHTLLELQPLIAFYKRVLVSFARENKIAAAHGQDGSFLLLMADTEAWPHLANLSKLLRCSLIPRLSDGDSIVRYNNLAYEQLPTATVELAKDLDVGQILDQITRERSDLLDGADDAPVIRLVNHILLDAIKAEASDIHIQPAEDQVMTRLRVDGALYDHIALPKVVQEEVVSRIKILGRMNIAEKRMPQDGRSTVELGDRLIDLRISTVPTDYGERVVIRLLDKSARLYHLDELGMSDTSLVRFRQLIRLEHGLILVTGPTGSGKTTTLYAALQELDAARHNILTIEDPIEYRLPRISQMQVSEKKGMTFASGLRSMLRQDPDIIMVGEIRDRETAAIAIQSALTGHLVFSTLHTNDSASAVTRLLDLGIEPYLLASCLAGVLAQRLVRTVCKSCGESCELSLEEQAWLRQDEVLTKQLAGNGCDRCRNSGYRGRIGVFELLISDPDIQQLMHQRARSELIRTQAIRHGMAAMRADGIAKVRAGRTSLTEVMRVAGIQIAECKSLGTESQT